MRLLLIKKSNRAKRMRITVRHDGRVTITVPFLFSAKAAENFARQKTNWILRKIEYFKRRGPITRLKGSAAEYKKLKSTAREFVKNRLLEINKLYNFRYIRVAIRNCKSRWGSCSKKGNLNFHYKIIHLPANLAEYLIVHELCHLKEFNHSKKFWGLVSRVIPNYRGLRKRLRMF